MLRVVDDDELKSLSLPTFVMASDPPNAFHSLSTVDDLVKLIPMPPVSRMAFPSPRPPSSAHDALSSSTPSSRTSTEISRRPNQGRPPNRSAHKCRSGVVAAAASASFGVDVRRDLFGGCEIVYKVVARSRRRVVLVRTSDSFASMRVSRSASVAASAAIRRSSAPGWARTSSSSLRCVTNCSRCCVAGWRTPSRL